MATTNYSWNLPTVGGSEDTWGTDLNANWTSLDTLLGGTNATEFAILDGATVTTAELNILDGVTATAAELNILDGVTATAAEINTLDGITATTTELNQLDGKTLAAGAEAGISANADFTVDTGDLATRGTIATFVGAEINTANVLAATAGAAFGAVGTYCLGYCRLTSPITEGDTIAGSNIQPGGLTSASAPAVDGTESVFYTRGSTALSGTWRAMGRMGVSGTRSTLMVFLRIS